jgi:predicted nucleic acid-binding protein
VTALVLDASVALAWGLPDETSAASEAALQSALSGGAVAPFHFPAEVAAAAFKAHRRGRISAPDVIDIRAALDLVPLELDLEGAERVWTESYRIAFAFGVGLYDAIYLELAMRRSLPLATLDEALRAAATRAGVSLAC